MRQEVRWVGDQRRWSQVVVGKATTQQKGPSGPPTEFGDQTSCILRCTRESHHQLESWVPRRPVEQSRRTRTTHGDSRSGWEGQCVAVFVRSPTPSHTQTLQIKWGVYFFKEVFPRLYSLCHYYSACICRCICLWVYNIVPPCISYQNKH